MPKLPPRQMQVLRLLAAGQTYAEIADALVVHKQTVKGYARELFVALDAKNAAHAVAIAYRTGLLVDEQEDLGELIARLAAAYDRQRGES